MKDIERKRIIGYYYTTSAIWTAKKCKVSQLHAARIARKWFEDGEWNELKDMPINKIMMVYGITLIRAMQLHDRFAGKLAGKIYFGQVKQAIYSSEQEMLIPEYNFNGLSESERIIYLSLP
jgi:hypothetical protein